MNNRELYFYFLKYIVNVIIVKENENENLIKSVLLKEKKINSKISFLIFQMEKLMLLKLWKLRQKIFQWKKKKKKNLEK